MTKERIIYWITEILKMDGNMQNKAGGIMVGIGVSFFMASFTFSRNFIEHGNFVLSLFIGIFFLIACTVPGLVVFNLKDQ